MIKYNTTTTAPRYILTHVYTHTYTYTHTHTHTHQELLGQHLRKQFQRFNLFLTFPPNHVTESLLKYDTRIKFVSPQLVCSTLKKSKTSKK
jgi:hypothetical protein